ncbi:MULTISPECIES: hypothetical protein [unclassified Mycobacterium]|uniref:hypothetical protein n=1 Tax=unclassified Mycobacterium TaxID=2642494 RepID=UPI0007FCAB91|nr:MULTISPECIES: hypothetical protein [unclassified Mycobacterium]OBG55784.1 hypothetical protein A5703_07500 [Mycobacterium sp. E188]OBH41080.1 hypothetical protein A5691_19325 [Mycobacterium sp. E183]
MAVTLSQIRSWSTQHLTDAASYWTQTADRWEDSFLTMRNQSQSIAWHGAGGDALRQRTGADLSVVTGKADQLRKAAGIARSGASDISSAKQQALHAIEDAQHAGFDVGEDLSVSYHDHGGSAAEQAAGQAQAEQLATEIWSRAAQLEAADGKVAGQLTAATAGLNDVVFSTGHDGSGVKLVDFDQNPGSQPPPFAPWDTPDGKAPPGAGLSPALQQMLLGGNPAKLTGQGLVDNLQQFVQSLPENDPRQAYLRGQLADLQAHVADIDYARTHCSTDDWIQRTTTFASGVVVTSAGVLTAETGAGLVVAGASGLGTVLAGGNLLKCLTGGK